MVLQAAADFRQVRVDFNSMAGEQIGGSDTGLLQKLGRIDRTAADDDFKARADLFQTFAQAVAYADGAARSA